MNRLASSLSSECLIEDEANTLIDQLDEWQEKLQKSGDPEITQPFDLLNTWMEFINFLLKKETFVSILRTLDSIGILRHCFIALRPTFFQYGDESYVERKFKTTVKHFATITEILTSCSSFRPVLFLTSSTNRQSFKPTQNAKTAQERKIIPHLQSCLRAYCAKTYVKHQTHIVSPILFEYLQLRGDGPIHNDKQAKRPIREVVVHEKTCTQCGGKDHQRPTSKKCPNFRDKKPRN